MANYYFEFANLNFNLVIGSLVLFGFLSVILTIWYKVEMKQNFEMNKAQIFHYKNSKIIWSTLGIGLITILVGKDLDSQIKILTFSIGTYLVLSQLVEYFSGKYFNTNILAVTESSLIDLNGRINEMKYKNIKGYEKEQESFTILESYEKLKYKTKDFKNSTNLIEVIDAQLKTNKIVR